MVLAEATMSRVEEVNSRSRGDIEMSEQTANRLKDVFRVYNDGSIKGGSRSQSKMSSKSRGSVENIKGSSAEFIV